MIEVSYYADIFFARKNLPDYHAKDVVVPYTSISDIQKDSFRIKSATRDIKLKADWNKFVLIPETNLPKITHVEFKTRIRKFPLGDPMAIIKSCDTWNDLFTELFKKKEVQELQAFVRKERETKIIYPEGKKVLAAYELTPYDKVRVVMLGTEPDNTGNSHGLAFSSIGSQKATLQNIFAEIINDVYAAWDDKQKAKIFDYNDLTGWAEQGVLLLNSILTVEKSLSGSHKGKGWEEVTAEIFKLLNKHHNKLVFMLWGKTGQHYKQFITNSKHLILETDYPIKESFFGCKHFSQANTFLEHNAPFGSKVGITWAVINKKSEAYLR